MDENKNAAEIANQTIARVWYDGIDLTLNGIDLADCITYDVLNVLGRAWLTDASREAQKAQEKASQ